LNFYRKLVNIALITFISAAIFSGCSPVATYTSNKDLLLVHYIDVGQADSILIQVNGKNMLIDAGNRGDGDKVVSYLKAHGVESLDYVVATHPHEDHIGGMSEVIKKIPIENFYAPRKTAATKTFEDMINALDGKKITAAMAGVELNLGADAKAEFIAPNSEKYEDINNYSSALKLTYGSNKFLFMGDAEKLSEDEIIKNNIDLSADVLKVGHHGSSTSSSKDFLDKVSPKIAVISVGKGNDYGHPHKETLAEFKKKEVLLFTELISMAL
jgi:competence protein ComEC